MASNIGATLQRLALSAAEIKQLTNWPDPMVEDYLNLLENLIRVVNAADSVTDGVTELNNSQNSNTAAILSGIKRELSSYTPEQVKLHSRAIACDHVQTQPSRMPRFTIDDLTFTNLMTGNTTSDTNTPSGATVAALEIQDATGSTVGYVPIYGSLW